jgi:hypothetical protein
MKKFILLFFLCSITTYAQNDYRFLANLEQSGLYYFSDNITIAGLGPGLGMALYYKENFVIQFDMNIYWANGNSFSNNISIGYKKSGTWSPAIMANLSVLWGSRTEKLLEDGKRPIYPLLIYGLKVAPLRFENKIGMASALEFGYGFGKYRGNYIELTLLSVGFFLNYLNSI